MAEPKTFKVRDKETGKVFTVREKVSPENPKQTEVDKSAEQTRRFVGRSISRSPMDASAALVSGRLSETDPISDRIGAMIDGAIQTSSFGIPKAITKKILESNGLKYPDPKDKTAENVGKIIGLIAPGKIAMNLTGKISGLAGNTLAKSISRAATEGAMIGFTESPDDFTDISQRIKQTVGYSAAAALTATGTPFVLKGINVLSKASSKAINLAQKVRASLFEAKSSIGKEFESQLNSLIENNPSKVVNLEEAFSNLKKMAEENSRLLSDFKSGAKKAGLDPKLVQGFIDNPASASEMTLNQSRAIKQAISDIPGIKSNLSKGKFANWNETQIDLLDFTDQIKKAQLDTFPELSEINKTYSEKISKYNLVKDKFRVGKLLDNMEKNFGDKEVQKIVNELLPKEIVKEMGGYRFATKFLKTVGWIAAAGAGGAAGKMGWNIFSK